MEFSYKPGHCINCSKLIQVFFIESYGYFDYCEKCESPEMKEDRKRLAQQIMKGLLEL